MTNAAPVPSPRAIEILLSYAGTSPCRKSKRGALLLAPDGCWWHAVNRPTQGACDGSEACRRDCNKICTHAEEGVVVDAGDHACGADIYHLKTVDAQPVPSGEPSCITCSRLMLRAGVAGVWLLQEGGWRRWTAAEFHQATLINLGLHRNAP